MTQLQELENNKTHEKNTNRTFPCAYCRTVLSSSTWITSENKNEKALFNHFLENAIAAELEENEKKEREKEKEKEIEMESSWHHYLCIMSLFHDDI